MSAVLAIVSLALPLLGSAEPSGFRQEKLYPESSFRPQNGMTEHVSLRRSEYSLNSSGLQETNSFSQCSLCASKKHSQLSSQQTHDTDFHLDLSLNQWFKVTVLNRNIPYIGSGSPGSGRLAGSGSKS